MFKIGDKVRRRCKGKAPVQTVKWVSKCGELVATELNGYGNPYDEAKGYVLAEQVPA